MDFGFVYLWENLINSKKYIGSHKGNLTDNYIGSGVHFKRAYQKNKENFIRHILYSGKYYREYEDKLLKKLKVSESKEYYNLKNDAIGGWEHTHNNDKIKNYRASKISEAKKGKKYSHLDYDKFGIKNPMYGKNHSEESKLKMKLKKEGISNYSKRILEKTSGLIFNSISDCADYYGLKQSTLSIIIKKGFSTRGKLKGKIFEYA